MKRLSFRPGSAILVVLGMTAFLLVSAIAFSAYMRFSRLPSSYLRRTSATRLMAKAAVARAIDAVDAAIGNNPHPGVGDENHVVRAPYDRSPLRNVWVNRVLVGTNKLLNAESPFDANTVSPLCLEALAYIPPPLVNEARFYSRRSPTARWHALDFDVGRYSFCALDVSDYFDINRLRAGGEGGGRSSASNRRVSLAYLFENDQHTSAGDAKAWDDFVDEVTQRQENPDTQGFTFTGSTTPFISLADFNLALKEKGSVGPFRSAFGDYVTGMNGTAYYGGGEAARRNARLTFVTDSRMVPIDAKSENDPENESDYDELYDLTGDDQPFDGSFVRKGKSSSATATQVVMSGKRGKARLLNHIPTLSLFALVDYLDDNGFPISLAIPTTERAPMCVGMKPNLNNAQIKVTATDSGVCIDPTCQTPMDFTVPPTDPVGTVKDVYQKLTYKLDPSVLLGGLGSGVETLFTYPFNHADGLNDSFEIDGRLAAFFTLKSDPMGLRTGSGPNDVLHLDSNFASVAAQVDNNGLLVIPLEKQTYSPSTITTQKDAVKKVTLASTKATTAVASLNNHPISTVVYTWKIQVVTDGMGNKMWTNQTRPANAGVEDAVCNLPPIKSNGEVNGAYANPASYKSLVQAGGGEPASLNVVVHVRVKNRDGKTVDLVPAHMKDDNTFNNLNNTGFPGYQAMCGTRWPVMRFGTGAGLDYGLTALAALAAGGQSAQVTISPAVVTCDDPRYNHAPENWVDDTANASLDAQLWIDENGSSKRDGDIFMSVSDQGYLQSIYELAFLPRLSNLENVSDPHTGFLASLDSKNYSTFPAKGQAHHQDQFWRTYRPYATDDGPADDFTALGFTSAGTGFKINPYSDSTNVLMAAFANTPVDWRMASTNNQEETGLEEMTAANFNAEYAWNQLQSENRIYYEDLEKIAGNFMQAIVPGRGSASLSTSYKDWRAAYDDLDWFGSGGADELAGVVLKGFSDTKGLWAADRRFLYGFWRDCFAVRQQLFLIFVRAEPAMMGSGSAGQIPPQLGARAMALVWRDPRPSKDPQYPHQTRVLFYRQFE